MRKSLIVLLCFIVVIAFAGVAMASALQTSMKEIVSKQADQRASSPATTSPQFNLMEALTPKIGVVFYQIKASEALGQQGSAVIFGDKGARVESTNAAAVDSMTIIAIGTKTRSTGTIISAGWEKPGCDIVAHFGEVNKAGRAASLT